MSHRGIKEKKFKLTVHVSEKKSLFKVKICKSFKNKFWCLAVLIPLQSKNSEKIDNSLNKDIMNKAAIDFFNIVTFWETGKLPTYPSPNPR